MSSGKLFYDVGAVSNQERRLGGNFKPAGTGAPVRESSLHGWTVSRTAAGRFKVTLTGSIGEIKNLRASLQIDPAGATQPLACSIGAVSLANRTFEIDVFNTTTGALTDIVQPVSPTKQGSFVHWHFQKSNGQGHANTWE